MRYVRRRTETKIIMTFPSKVGLGLALPPKIIIFNPKVSKFLFTIPPNQKGENRSDTLPF